MTSTIIPTKNNVMEIRIIYVRTEMANEIILGIVVVLVNEIYGSVLVKEEIQFRMIVLEKTPTIVPDDLLGTRINTETFKTVVPSDDMNKQTEAETEIEVRIGTYVVLSCQFFGTLCLTQHD